jgi:aspartate aminotransferase
MLLSRHAGIPDIRQYRYWDAKNRSLDLPGMLADLEAAPENSAAIFHGCAHNPTGMDPTQEQWKQICEVVKKKNIFPFMDIAYQGFATGDPDLDAWAVRYFAAQGLEILVAQSFAKNFGLYNERVGHLSVVVGEVSVVASVRSHLAILVRANWSNPPNHGAKVVHMVLSDPQLRQQWFDCIKAMSSRIKEMRASLRAELETLGTPGEWSHITRQIGMFSFTGLTEAQVMYLREKYHIYFLKNGRINMCGLNTKNVAYVAKAFDDAVRNA